MPRVRALELLWEPQGWWALFSRLCHVPGALGHLCLLPVACGQRAHPTSPPPSPESQGLPALLLKTRCPAHHPPRAAEASLRQLRAPCVSPEGSCPGAAGRGQAHPGRRQRLQTQGGNTSVQRRPSLVVPGALGQVGSGLTASALP